MKNNNQYDFIICGSGCAGLSLLVYMIESGKFSEKRILMIDKEEKNKNDRTWCFWEKGTGIFESIVYKKWKQTWFHGDNFSACLDLAPYEYKMIRGIDFYSYCFDLIRKQKNMEILYGEITEITHDISGAHLTVKGITYQANFIFNSILFSKPQLTANEYYLLQHFKGWVIETEGKYFDPAKATLMDFRSSQSQGTTFVYVMPFTENRALVEYTIFSSSLLQTEQYDVGLEAYIRQHLKINDYKITDIEFGVIPMTNHRFKTNEGNIINIGTAGGQTKASSGYTFSFIQKNSAAIVQQLITDGNPFITRKKERFRFYDSVLLNILHHKSLPGKSIFTDLFKKNKTQSVLRFLDNESSFMGELKIISSLPTLPFLKSAFRQL